jgi:transposase InsO family protein
MKTTANMHKPLAEWVTKVENQLGTKVKMIRTDNGPEFTSDGFKSWARTKGVHIEYSETYTPELNGRSERSNRIWMDGVRSMLNDAKLPKKYWVFALKAKNYLLNRTGTNVNQNFMTPYEKMFGVKPKVNHLRIFGAKGHAQITKSKKKLQPRAEKIQLLGYAEDHDGYVVQYVKDKRIGVARTISVEKNTMENQV